MAKKAFLKSDVPRLGSTEGRGSTERIVARPPAKNVHLLTASIALFGLWFVFLLVTALWK